MAPFLAFALLVVQDSRDTYGKSNAQILAMGHDAWYKFYTGKAGDSTLGMAYAEKTYAEALGARNEALAAKRKDRPSIRALHKALENFYIDAVEAGQIVTGGGTMWTPISNAYWVDMETTVYRTMVPGKPAPHRVNSDVTKEIALLRKAMAGSDVLPEDRKRVAPTAAKLEGDWKVVSAIASTLDRRRSDLALEFCRSTLKDARETGEPR